MLHCISVLRVLWLTSMWLTSMLVAKPLHCTVSVYTDRALWLTSLLVAKPKSCTVLVYTDRALWLTSLLVAKPKHCTVSVYTERCDSPHCWCPHPGRWAGTWKGRCRPGRCRETACPRGCPCRTLQGHPDPGSSLRPSPRSPARHTPPGSLL